MKRFIAVLLTVVLLLSCALFFVGCKRDKRTIRLCEVTHSIFYAPLYVAINNGYFTDRGITIELTDGKGANNVMAAITSKSADIGLMGPEATVYCHVEGQQNYPVIFGQLTQRDGSFLVAKTAQPNFKWSDLEGKRVLAGRPGGVPAMTLQYVVETVGGLSLDKLNFDTTVPFENMSAVFDSDSSVDYTTMFEPVASSFVKSGRGHIVASVGADSGNIPYTAFSASKSYLSSNKDVVADFLAAVMEGYKFMTENTAEEVARVISPSFFETDVALIASAIKNYLEIGAWSATPVMSEESFNRLQDVMQNAGHLSTRADYNVAVDNSIALGLLAA